MGLIIHDLHAAYGAHAVLHGLSLEASLNEMVFLLGANGAGKSTLFRCILGQMHPSSGEVLIDGRPSSSYHPRELAGLVAYIPQSSAPAFHYTVLQMTVMGRTARLSAFASPSDSDYAVALETLERLGIAQLAHKSIAEISGGEYQLMLIARALVQQAGILLMDEPTASLDFGNQIRVLSVLRELTRGGLLVLQSSHNPQHALLYADRVIAIAQGKAVASGPTRKVLTASLLQELYGVEVSVQNNAVIPKDVLGA